MQELFLLVYTSRATRKLSPEELDSLLNEAREFNAAHNLTGVLFHSPEMFYQYLEGPKAAIEEVFERIRAAKSHTDIKVLIQTPIGERQFRDWHMGFARAPQTALQELAQAGWEDAMPMTRTTFRPPAGIGLTLEYWNRWVCHYAAPPSEYSER